jgi:hypothetical protein
MKEVLPWLVCSALHAGTRDYCPALAALVDPVQNTFLLTKHYFNSLSSSPSKLGRQSCRVFCLLRVSLLLTLIGKLGTGDC